MYIDIAMPLTLFVVMIVAMALSRKVDKKFKTAFQERQLGVRDVISIVAGISTTVSLVVFIPRMGIMIMFLFSYSMLLFVFTYLFSDLQKAKVRVFCVSFLVISFVATATSLLSFNSNGTFPYGAIAFLCFFGFASAALLYEEKRTSTDERWYLAVLPPALFILLYLFFGTTPIWFPFLLDLYGLTFAVLIVLYLGSMFTWKTSLVFAGLLTVMDIVMVLFTGTMVSAARHVSPLRLPVLVSLPAIPQIQTESGVLFMSLGLGDFFFAGLLAVQTLRKFSKGFAVWSAVAMSISFAVFEALMLNYDLGAFPGTLMIICGWFPIILLKSQRKKLAP